MKNFSYLILGLLFYILPGSSFAQTTLFSDNFENSTGWQISGSVNNNSWIIDDCTNNGGTHSLYVSSGGPLNDCSPTGKKHYGYANSLVGTSQETIIAQLIDATCFSAMQASFDLQIQGEVGQDYFDLIYSLDNGVNWIAISPQLANVFPYTATAYPLPALLNGQQFLLGFRFTFNQTVVGANAPSIDNLIVQGTSSDNQAPVITCPTAGLNVPADITCNYTIVSMGNLVTITDNCGPFSIVQTPAIGTVISSPTPVNFTVTDPSGFSASCAFTLSIIDTTAPNLNCPVSLNAFTDINCNAQVPDYESLIQYIENCTPASSMSFSLSPVAGTVFSNNFSVTATVTDLAGNQSTCVTNFVLVDTLTPTITCPATQQVPVGSSCNASLPDFTSLAVVQDNCSSSNFVYNQAPSISTILSAGNHIVTIQVQDEAGNVGSCQFTAQLIDTTAPVLTCPAAFYEPTNASCASTLSDYSSQVSLVENCSTFAALTYGQSPNSGIAITSPTLVTLTVTDTNGNQSACAFTVYPIDTMGPIATCISDTLISISNPCSITVPNLVGTHTAVDNCTASNLLSVSQSPIAGTVISSPTIIIVTYTDTTGNSGTCMTQIIPIDNVPPVITCPGTQSLNNGSSCTAALPDLSGLVTITDNCSQFTLSQSPASGTVLNSGSNVITFTVTDLAGNQASCTSIYSILENVQPNISCPSSISGCNPLVNYSAPVATDNCAFIVNQTDVSGLTSGDIFPVGITTQTYQVTDSSGNSQSCSFTIEVFEYPDTAQVVQDTIYLCQVFQTTVSALPYQSGTGTWSVLSGGGNLTTPNATTTLVQNLSSGTNLIVWTISSPTCGVKKDTVVIIVNAPAPQAVLQDTIIACDQNGYIIQGSSPGNGQGTWSTTSGIGFSNIHAPITGMNSVPVGYSSIYWTVGSLGCSSTTDSAIVYKPNIAIISNIDTTICKSQLPYSVVGNLPSEGESFIWNIVSANGQLSNKFITSTYLESAGLGQVTITYKLTHPGCGSTTDTLRLTVIDCGDNNVVFPTLFTPNNDGTNDYFEIPNALYDYPNCEYVIVNRWGSKVFESTGIPEPWDGTYNGEPVPMGTYYFSISSPTDSFDRITGPISLIR